MKLKRTWPAIGIWVIFLLFNILMVGSYSFFSGLFPESERLVYSIVLTVLGILVMSVLTNSLGKLCDSYDSAVYETTSFRVLYLILLGIVIIGGVIYRIEILSITSGDITGNYSLYENAMIGGTPSKEYDLLSIVYTGLLRPVLFFTGNIISVPFYFQIACFTFFILFGTMTVRMLLGRAAAFVFAVYTSFMPVFTTAFTGLELSTDSLFIAMFGIELFLVALFLKGIVNDMYTSTYWVIWYVFIGAVIGFMNYVDAGTLIMIIPFLLASLVICGSNLKSGIIRLLFVAGSGFITFLLLLSQEAGTKWLWARLRHWVSYFFNNTNTFSTFWTYTDYKILYLITVIGMSGVIVGFWKNRNIEKVSPWLLSMLLVFATVPFMGPTRMNTQVIVTIYYGFILACVASLITTRADETEMLVSDDDDEDESGPLEEEDDEEEAEEEEEEEEEAKEQETPEGDIVKEADESEEEAVSADDSEKPATSEDTATEDDSEKSATSEDTASEDEAKESAASADDTPDKPSESDAEYVAEIQKVPIYSTLPGRNEEDEISSPEPEAVDEYVITLDEKAESFKDLQEAIRQLDELSKVPRMISKPRKAEKHFVPEGMVLPEDDEDADLTPRMKLPQLKNVIGSENGGKKLKVTGTIPEKKPVSRVEFDFPLRPGDDFDID